VRARQLRSQYILSAIKAIANSEEDAAQKAVIAAVNKLGGALGKNDLVGKIYFASHTLEYPTSSQKVRLAKDTIKNAVFHNGDGIPDDYKESITKAGRVFTRTAAAADADQDNKVTRSVIVANALFIRAAEDAAISDLIRTTLVDFVVDNVVASSPIDLIIQNRRCRSRARFEDWPHNGFRSGHRA
jgi:hypothetical protein